MNDFGPKKPPLYPVMFAVSEMVKAISPNSLLSIEVKGRVACECIYEHFGPKIVPGIDPIEWMKRTAKWKRRRESNRLDRELETINNLTSYQKQKIKSDKK